MALGIDFLEEIDSCLDAKEGGDSHDEPVFIIDIAMIGEARKT